MINKIRMNEFLKTGQADYFMWLRENYPNEVVEPRGCCGDRKQEARIVEPDNDEPPDATFGTMFTDLAKSFHAIIKSGGKVVDNDEHLMRYTICKKCKHLSILGFCKKCGCKMRFKSKFASVRCKLGKW